MPKRHASSNHCASGCGQHLHFPDFRRNSCRLLQSFFSHSQWHTPRCPAIKKQRLHGNGEGQRFYFSTGKPSFLGLVGLGRGVSGHSSAFPIRKAERANAWGQWLVDVSCILFLCFPVCLSHLLFCGVGPVGQYERRKKMQQD